MKALVENVKQRVRSAKELLAAGAKRLPVPTAGQHDPEAVKQLDEDYPDAPARIVRQKMSEAGLSPEAIEKGLEARARELVAHHTVTHTFCDEPAMVRAQVKRIEKYDAGFTADCNKLIERDNALTAKLQARSFTAANQAYKAAQAQGPKDALAGKELSEVLGWSFEDWQEHFERDRKSIKQARRDLGKEAAPYVVKFWDRIADSADESAAKLQETERKAAEQHGAKYAETPVYWQLKALAYRARRYSKAAKGDEHGNNGAGANIAAVKQVLEYLK